MHVYGELMDVYTLAGNGSRVWRLSEEEVQFEGQGLQCTVRERGTQEVFLQATGAPPVEKDMPTSLHEVLEDWGHEWMWRTLRLTGTDEWLRDAIAEGTLLAVTDGSYIKELHPELGAAAFILECGRGRGRLVGSFPELSPDAYAYRGKMLGLLSIHLLLLAMNRVYPELEGQVSIYSDCLGAIRRVADVPVCRIPSRTKHADILKIIMAHCQDYLFPCRYHHVRAHQDDKRRYQELLRPAQLNCQVNFLAKSVIWGLEGRAVPPQDMLPLEAVGIFAGKSKITSGPAETLRFWASRTIAKGVFTSQKILFGDAFDEVAWRVVHTALWEVPRLFQIWAAKQVMGLAGTNEMQARYKEGHDKKCPSCNVADETCGHILHCQEEGRVEVLEKLIDLLDDWLIDQGTDEELRFCLMLDRLCPRARWHDDAGALLQQRCTVYQDGEITG
jgi:hypothetical protein